MLQRRDRSGASLFPAAVLHSRRQGGRDMYLRIAHRGAPHLAPELSLKSSESALPFSPEMVAMDVRVSRDGHIIVMHDATVDRMTTGRGKVVLKTLAQLRACRLGNGEPV